MTIKVVENWQAGYAVRISRGTAEWQVFVPPSTPPRVPRSIGLLGLAYEVDPFGVSASSGARADLVTLTLRLWTPALLFAVYPSIALFRGPIRNASRRARSQCWNCAYYLVGNESVVCPECGEPNEAWYLPRWKRAVIALLVAAIFGWIAEFVLHQTAFDHRVAIWMFRTFAWESGSWVVTSTLRTVIAGLACIGMYFYLSPERFGE